MDKAYDQMKVREMNGTLIVTIPKRIRNFLELEAGQTVELDAETGKHGKYMSLWKKKVE